MSHAPTHSHQVLVVGAGPVGLLAGVCAARRGLDVAVLDQNWRGYAPGHATVLHPSSVRLLAELDLLERLNQAGHRLDRLAIYVDGSHAKDLALESPALAVAQSVLEETLLGALRAEGVELMTPVQATTIEQGGDRVNVRAARRELVTLGSPAQYSDWETVESFLIHTDHVIGADGYDSRVRAALGIEMLDVGAAESFSMFEYSSTRASNGTMDLGFARGLGSAIVPLADGRTRAGFQLDAELSLAPDLERLQQLLSERTPWFGFQPDRLDWGTVTHFERRLARPFGRKRVWLAGDAAHITSPFGGHSMNVGLAEVHGLVQRIADCAQGRKSLESLSQYEAQRQREWHKILGVNVHYDLMANAPKWLAPHARRIVPALPSSGRDLEHLLSQLGLAIR